MALTEINSLGIKDLEVKTADIANDAITNDKIATGAVTSDSIGAAAVTGNGLQDLSVGSTKIANDAVTLAKMAGGTDGQIITYDASGDPIAVGPGTDGQVLTSTGAGSPPAFEDAAAGVGGASGVDFNDTVKARFGTGNDLAIYHNGTDAIIDAEDAGATRSLILKGGTTTDRLIELQSSDGEPHVRCAANGAVSLYYNNTKCLETKDLCVEIQKEAIIRGVEDGDARIYMYADEADDNADKWQIGAATQGHWYLQNYKDGAWETSIECNGGGNVELYYDNDLRIRTESSGNTYWGQNTIIKDSQAVWFRPATSGSSTYIEWWDDGSSARQAYVGFGNGTEGTSAFYIEHELNGMMKFFTNNTEHFRIEANGDLKATDTSIGSISDQRLKKNITDFTYDLSKFKQFKPRTFDWINPEYHGNKSGERGFVAQELESIDGSLVGRSELEYGKDAEEKPEPNPDLDIIKADDGTDFAKDAKLGTNDAMYISVIQQLIAKIETLETKVAALEAG